MEIKNVYGMFFSATGTTEKIVKAVAGKVNGEFGLSKAEMIDFTLPGARKKKYSFAAGDLIVFGTPTYAGRVPNVLLPFIRGNIGGNGATAIPVVLFGNRDFDDSLIELAGLLRGCGFKIAAAGAFVGEHSFSYKLAKGRPDKDDIIKAEKFASLCAAKIRAADRDFPDFRIKGEDPVRPYYTPRDRNGNGIDIRKVKPVTIEGCDKCGVCQAVCPMGSIDMEDPSLVSGICIKCGACVKKCPKKCKAFTDDNYLYHMHELEDIYTERKEPELFL